MGSGRGTQDHDGDLGEGQNQASWADVNDRVQPEGNPGHDHDNGGWNRGPGIEPETIMNR